MAISSVSVITSNDIDDLVEKINTAIGEGWQPHPSGVREETSQNTEFTFMHLMVRNGASSGGEAFESFPDLTKAIADSKTALSAINTAVTDIKASADYNASLDSLVDGIAEKSNEISSNVGLIETELAG